MYIDKIEKVNQWLSLAIVVISIIAYYVFGGNAMLCLIVSVSLLVYAIIKQGGVLQNRVTKFISSVSMEIYLSHMLIFRIIEKLHLNMVFGNGWLQYVITVVTVIVGAIIFALVTQFMIKKTEALWERNRGKRERG